MTMRRRWNLPVWLGFALGLAAALAYLPLSDPLPGTADWIALIAMLGGLALLVAGLVRAWREPGRVRGKIAAPLLALVMVALTGLFLWGTFIEGRALPASAEAPRPGATAPDFSLTDARGATVSLRDLLGGRGALLIFYRGHW